MTKSNTTNTSTPTGLGTMGLALFEAGLINADGTNAIEKPETSDERKERLIGLAKEAGLRPNSRWKLETLETKLKDAGVDPDAKSDDDSTDEVVAEVETPEVVVEVETPEVVVEVETPEVVAEVETTEVAAEVETTEVADADSEPAPVAAAKPDAITEAEGLTVGQIVPGVVEHKLPHAVLIKTEAGPVVLMDRDQVSGRTFHDKKVWFETTEKGTEVAVQVMSIKPNKTDKRRNYDIKVSMRAIEEEAVRDGISCGTVDNIGTTVTIEVREVRGDYVRGPVVEGPAKGTNAMLHVSEVSLGDKQEREGRIASYKSGETLTAEVVEIKQDKGKDQMLCLSTKLAEVRELVALAPANRNEAGATLSGSVNNIVDFGAFVVIETDGPAKGRHALFHITQFPGRPDDKAEALKALEVGHQLSGEVTKVELRQDGRVDIGLSLTAADRRARKAAFEKLESEEITTTATCINSFSDGALCEFTVDGQVFKGKLPSSECPGNFPKGGRTKVKVDYVEQFEPGKKFRRIFLTRRGL